VPHELLVQANQAVAPVQVCECEPEAEFKRGLRHGSSVHETTAGNMDMPGLAGRRAKKWGPSIAAAQRAAA
jgi:hypothetical protein